MAEDDEGYDVNQVADPEAPVKYFQYAALRDYLARELKIGLERVQENQEQFAENITRDLQNTELLAQQNAADITRLVGQLQRHDDDQQDEMDSQAADRQARQC